MVQVSRHLSEVQGVMEQAGAGVLRSLRKSQAKVHAKVLHGSVMQGAARTSESAGLMRKLYKASSTGEGALRRVCAEEQ